MKKQTIADKYALYFSLLNQLYKLAQDKCTILYNNDEHLMIENKKYKTNTFNKKFRGVVQILNQDDEEKIESLLNQASELYLSIPQTKKLPRYFPQLNSNFTRINIGSKSAFSSKKYTTGYAPLINNISIRKGYDIVKKLNRIYGSDFAIIPDKGSYKENILINIDKLCKKYKCKEIRIRIYTGMNYYGRFYSNDNKVINMSLGVRFISFKDKDIMILKNNQQERKRYYDYEEPIISEGNSKVYII